MAKKTADALRYVRGIQGILRKIREEEWQRIEEKLSRLSTTLGS